MNLSGIYADLNRFTLTLSQDNSNDDWSYFDSGCWSNGNIKVINNTFLFQSYVLPGGAENTIRHESPSGYCVYNSTGDKGNVNTLWKMELGNKTKIYARGGTSGWSGPVTLEGDTQVKTQNVWARVNFWGPISGAGNIGKTSDAGSAWTYTSRGVTIKLANATNSFTGGIWLKYNILDAAVDGAVPVNGGAVDSNNSTIKLTKATEYHLPDLVLSGTGASTPWRVRPARSRTRRRRARTSSRGTRRWARSRLPSTAAR
jgi:hypothetical protein